MSKTNKGLVEYAKAQVGLPYWYGCYGQISTQALYNSKKKQYPSQYTASDYSSQYGMKVHDCSGLIKGYLWCDSVDGTPTYNASQDRSAKLMYSDATEKGKISTLPEIDGVLVFKGTYASSISHVGVYCTDGYVYEAKSHSAGVKKTKFTASDWNFWAKHKDIEYSVTEETTVEVLKEVIAGYGAKDFDSTLSGTYEITASGLNLRNGAGTKYKSLVVLPKGNKTQCYGYYTEVSGTKWLYVVASYNDVQYTGFCSEKYLEKK